MGQFLPAVLNSARRMAFTTLDITTPTVLETHLLFHSIATVEEVIKAKIPKYFRS